MQTNPHRWFGVGQSHAPDSAKAGAEAAGEAIGGRDPKLRHKNVHGKQLPPLGLARDTGEDIRVLRPGDDEERSVRGTAEIRTALSDAPFAGFYPLGEIARVRGAIGLHHLTLVTLALA
jgi:hypothetical protein